MYFSSIIVKRFSQNVCIFVHRLAYLLLGVCISFGYVKHIAVYSLPQVGVVFAYVKHIVAYKKARLQSFFQFFVCKVCREKGTLDHLLEPTKPEGTCALFPNSRLVLGSVGVARGPTKK